MSRQTPPPVFLQKASYRQRRLRDAAKLMPFLGIVLWAIPLAWSSTDGDTPVGTNGLIYVFGVWVFLIILTGILASRIKSDRSSSDQGEDGP